MVCMATHAQVTITRNGKALSRIIVDRNDSTDLRAATLLQEMVKKISGADLSIMAHSTPAKKGDILIGRFQLPLKSVDVSSLQEDGYWLSSNDGYLRIINGSGKGSIYGVVTLLEQYFDVQYYAVDAWQLPKQANLSLPAFQKTDNPSFRYRQTNAYSLSDPIYKLWHRLEEPKEVFAGNLWVHTFDKILPSKDFGAAHPEFYSLIKGERRPGAASQWCLTNDQLFEIVSHRIDSIFNANPGKDIISVSQNDGNYTNCSCDKCKAIDDAEGGPSGSLIYFMNKLAVRFPAKQFSTLAYLYSVSPPKTIKPLPNVNIMLCDIDCRREVPLNQNASGQLFVKDMEGWSKLSNNIFVWDYGINFDNYVSPFPNFHVLQPNMQLFKQNNATMHFSQIGGQKGTDFSELRSYMVTKLMWNVSLDVDSLMKKFLSGYYGDAAPFIYQYIKLQEGAVMADKASLWIYDTPISHKEGLLNPSLLKKYSELFDKAEQAVAKQTAYLKRVRESRLSLQYAALEIARTEPVKNVPLIQKELDVFRQRAKEANVSVLNERLNTIEEYYSLYIERNFPRSKKSLAGGAAVHYILPPSPAYLPISDKALTDELFGGATYNESWVGWEGKDGELVIDLGSIKQVERIEPDFMHKLGAWIFLPKSVSCSVSTDNKNFESIGTKNIAEDQEGAVKYVPVPFTLQQKKPVRYIKLKIETIGICPSWHYGVGYPAWFFLDEVSVY